MRFELLPPVPAITASRKLREIPLFRFASVDELFRISQIARQVRYEPAASVQRGGEPAEYIQVLVEGRVRVPKQDGNGGAGDESLSAPAILGFREALEGRTLRQEVHAETEAVALVMAAEDFRSLMADNIELAQGLFRMLLGSGDEDAPSVHKLLHSEGGSDGSSSEGLLDDPVDGEPLNAVDRVLRLQTIPILSHATGEELYELAMISREERKAPDESVFSEGQPPSIFLPLAGRLAVEAPDGTARGAVGPGHCVGVRETLAGRTWSFRARAEVPTRSLVVEREALFDLLADRTHLLQCVFSSVFRNPEFREAYTS